VKKNTLRATIEVAFIITLFYSNLLMGEYARMGQGFEKGFIWALFHIFTLANFAVAFIMACAAYLMVEYLRRKFYD